MADTATFRSATFSDFDAFASSIEDASMSMKLPRLDRSLWSMQQICLPDAINVQVAYEGSGSIPVGAVREDGFVLFLAEGDCHANGEPVDRDAVFLMPPGKEFSNPTKGENEWLAVFIPYATAEVTNLFTSRDDIGTSARVVHPSGGAAERLRSLIKRFVVNSQAEPSLLQEFASVASFRNELADRVKACLFADAANSKNKTGRPKSVDAAWIAGVVELIEESPEYTPTVAELVSTLDVSERSIQNGFQKYLGVSPRKYMELCRLHRARKQLKLGSPQETTVTKVAAQVGMWDFGRFAARYRVLFGERPSETLSRRRN